MKLNSLYIQNFRILEDFEVKKLGRLNLIVGKNNSGKSSVLEALRIYAGGANRSLLTEIASGHDEIYPNEDSPSNNKESTIPFESFFTDRNFPTHEEKSIIIGETKQSNQSIWLKHSYYSMEEFTETDDKGQTNSKIRTKIISKSELNEFTDKEIFHALIGQTTQAKKFFIPLTGPRAGRRLFTLEADELFPCSFIPTQFVSLDKLADEWDKIALTEHEEQVKTALKFIEPNLESLAFIKNEKRSINHNFKRSAIVKIANSKPVPLSSMGDSMLRLLQLSLKVFPAKNGFLLIDEFENGLHYSVQEEVWNWLFSLANDLNIQVFATTHSFDCVQSFAKVALRKKNTENISGILFRVGRSAKIQEKNKVIATEFDADELANLTKADIEIR